MPFETALHSDLCMSFYSKEVSRLSHAAKEISSTLGPWCADRFWSLSLNERVAERFAQRLEAFESRRSASQPTKGQKSVEDIDAETKRIDEAAKIVANYKLPDPTPSSDCLSSKVMLLLQQLEHYFKEPKYTKAMVFVDQRMTAKLLHDLFRRIGPKALRASVLIGISSEAGNYSEMGVSLRQQIITLEKFRKGVFNCLVGYSASWIELDVLIRVVLYVSWRRRSRYRRLQSDHKVRIPHLI